MSESGENVDNELAATLADGRRARDQFVRDWLAHGLKPKAISALAGLSVEYITALNGKSAPQPEQRKRYEQKPEPLKTVHAARNNKICEMYVAGYPVNEISSRYDVSRANLYNIVNKAGAFRWKVKGGGGNVAMEARDQVADHKERHHAICQLYLGGKTLEECGKVFGVTRERIRQILVAEGVTERLGGFFSERRTSARERAKAATITRKASHAKKMAKRMEVRELYDAGFTYEDIAKHFGHTTGWVQAEVWKTGGPSRYSSAKKLKGRLKPEDRAEIGKRYAAGEPVDTIANDYGIVPAFVGGVANSVGCYRPGYGPGINACTINKKKV